MVAKLFLPLSPICLWEQIVMMRRDFPNFRERWHKNRVTWVGHLQPSSLSRLYRIKMIYSLESPPKVRVLVPSLTDEADREEAIPHLYESGDLCLYHPKKHEWNRQMYLSKTIIPWTSLWLFYYEIWSITGEWLGGGEHPRSRRIRSSCFKNCLKSLDV
jgi:hypothetical protein